MSSNVSSIHFHYPYSSFALTHRRELKSFILKMISREKHQLNEINFIFCSDDYLLQLNRSYLNHDTLTDIITFPFSKPSEPIQSDIYISIERVRENAHTFQTPFYRELHRVIFHGVLHLCGYKDKSKKQSQQMRAMEEHYLNLYFVPRGTPQV